MAYSSNSQGDENGPVIPPGADFRNDSRIIDFLRNAPWKEDIDPDEEPEQPDKELTQAERLEQEERDLEAQYARLVTALFSAKHPQTPVYSKPSEQLEPNTTPQI
mmetsp:Transcript_30777/g.47913  ORF Transcript_30777/g.47913 Transcript_30777/m.47913 type:complete len:105 (-) Transcript_30777:484-798(-)|eukprot:CAMPEP_0201524564 /NCGR_PEP_ID=MMETSP0161_2-20130828/23407_1 /ASSEMBLY_ACC=CAM_ASM_000251 /TAXON_ID=180227 /ORGANISM="Neoparamoeba aestuarina, Strain SoJaBio B1-5/56/2" /LENGTH=104 /DNA_ID=CAMNT_0047924033 /DNA_START=117 /DNA_END=431 /DNA_ORIENTATION=+